MISFDCITFTTLHRWEDVIPFAGKVVAYTTDSPYFGSEKGYTIRNIHFGFIDKSSSMWGRNGAGYDMRKLLKPSDTPSRCPLTTDAIIRHIGCDQYINMRLATKEEIGSIIKAVTADEAVFEYYFFKKQTLDFLHKYFEKQ